MNNTILSEGPRDPHIFKAIFTAGIPGSGKTTVVKKLTASTGMKLTSFDTFHEYFIKRGHETSPAVLNRSRDLSYSQLDLYVDGRLGLIIDRTSWNYEKIRNLKSELESIGYETCMVFVNTDISVARNRVEKRYQSIGRSVSDDHIVKVLKQLQSNIGAYQRDFRDNFIIVDNSHDENLDTNLQFAQKKVDQFLRKPVRNPAATKWLEAHR